MKRIVATLLMVVLFVCSIPHVNAAENGTIVYSLESTLENGLTVHDEIVIYTQSRASDITADRKKTIYDGDTVVAIIVLRATFLYDGSTVSVVSKSVSQSDTYDGWEYVQNSLTSSGGTVTLNAKITKWFIFNTPFTMTLSCDKDGNISYT